MSPPDPLPPLVLRCRLLWCIAFSAAASALLLLGIIGCSGRGDDLFPAWFPPGAAPILILLGLAAVYFVGRFCFARLLLDAEGFAIVGPLVDRRVSWSSVIRWERRAQRGGPATLWIVHGPDRRRLSIPLIYRDDHLLELALEQRSFPRY